VRAFWPGADGNLASADLGLQMLTGQVFPDRLSFVGVETIHNNIREIRLCGQFFWHAMRLMQLKALLADQIVKLQSMPC
jgi:hypothetical protein